MRNDEKDGRLNVLEQVQEQPEESAESNHVVFDFTGLERPNLGDLSMILTARLQSAPEDFVWVRSLPWQTARILEVLKLDHLFRTYPEMEDELN